MEPAIIRIDSLDDPRVAPYRALKERELAREGGRFIAEGDYIVRRLLAGPCRAESVLLTERHLPDLIPLVPAGVPIYVTTDARLRAIIGFRFHSGVLACGLRPPRRTLSDTVPPAGPCTLVVCPEIASHENLGSLVRICAAFGVDALMLGERSCDPFWRRSVRVSMGTIFRLPVVHSDNLPEDLTRLRDECDVQLAATVLDDSAEPLSAAARPARFALLFGNEAHGLDERIIQRCRRRITIPMERGTDSLNVAVAAGIFLYHFTQRSQTW